MNLKVLVYPKDSNPYQELLYSKIPKTITITYLTGWTSSRLFNILLLPMQLVWYRIRGYSIFHLHWLYPFAVLSQNTMMMMLAEQYLRLAMVVLRVLKYQVVWTLHNLVPHEQTFANDERVRDWLIGQVDKIIVLNMYVLKQLQSTFPNDKEKFTYIPQGNYLGYYKFGAHTTKNNLTLGFVGQIKPYKGLETLIKVMAKIRHDDIKLVIEGQAADLNYFAKLKELASGDTRISLTNHFVSDRELGKLVTSFDIVILPFCEITNSSTVMLAFSAGVPVLTPRTGGNLDYPESIGIYYQPTSHRTLLVALEQAYSRRFELSKMGKAALTYAKQFDWHKIAQATAKIYFES